MISRYVDKQLRMIKCRMCEKDFIYNSKSIYFIKFGNGKKEYLCSYNCQQKALRIKAEEKE